jgi:hypothetical protein
MDTRTTWWCPLLAALALLPTQLACDAGSGPPAPIAIVRPGSGEIHAVDADMVVEWLLRDEFTKVNIDISRDGRLTWASLATDLDAEPTSYTWTVTGPVSTKCHLRISDAQDETRCAQTALPFEIAVPFLSVVSPNGNEKWGITSTRNIRWSQLGVSNVKIELGRQVGQPAEAWETIADTVAAADGSYAWTVTDPADTQCRMRVSDAAAGGTLSDESNADFEIAEPSLTLTAAPSGTYQLRDQMVISWTAIGIDAIHIEITRDGGGTWTRLASDLSAYAGTYTWVVSPLGESVPQVDCWIRIVSTLNDTYYDESGLFDIDWDGVYRVKPGGSDGNDGHTWETAMRNPDAAMGSGREIWVATGTYSTDLDSDGVVLGMASNSTVYGGFVGTEYDESLRNPKLRVTTLDGLDTAEHVVTGADEATIDGFTITGGAAPTSGGGMYNYYDTGVVVANCRFDSNSATTGGGGMCNNYSAVTVTNCVFYSNSAGRGGGADCYYSDQCDFSKCVFESNEATTTSYTRGGGGLEMYYTPGTVSNCVFYKNSAYCGGGAYVRSTTPVTTFFNCTMTQNTALYGGAVYDSGFDPTRISNTIIWSNTSSIYYYDTAITYSCVQGGVLGIGNIATDPKFRDVDGGNLRLGANSPCIDAGTSVGAPADDIEGNPRGTSPDMGAYEY